MARPPKDKFKRDKRLNCRIDFYFDRLLNDCAKITGHSKTDTIYEALQVYKEQLDEQEKRKNHIFM